MGAFADRIRQAAKNKPKSPIAPIAPVGGQTAAMAAQMQATTGRAVMQPAVTGQSNIMETMANLQTQQQMAVTDQQLQQTAEQVALQEKENAVRQQEVENQRLLKEQEYDNQADAVFNDLLDQIKYNDKDLEDREDQMQIEHAGRVLRLRNAEYRQKVMDIGRRQRLNDSLVFQEAYTRQVIGENMSALLQDLREAGNLAFGERTFNEAHLIEDMNMANEIYQAAMADQRNAAVFQGISTVIKAGGEYAADKKD